MTETTTPEPPLTVDEAFIAVMREIGPVGKNGRNKDQNYHFRAQEDIVAAARKPMAHYGLRMLPKVISHEHFTRGKVNVAIIEVEFTFRGPTGDTMPPILVIGEGADVSDKASNKAMTAAKKYAFIQAFEIADGADDGDNDHPAAVRGPLDWYLDQIRQPNIWQNAEALRKLRDRAVAEKVADLEVPDAPGQTFRRLIEGQGAKLIREQQERDQRKAEEREAVAAQMSAEYPTPDELNDDPWLQPAPPREEQHTSPGPAPTRRETPAVTREHQTPPASPVPDAAEIEAQLVQAAADPADCERRLNDLRARYGAGALAQTVVRTEWGTVDANSAITMALLSRPSTHAPDEAPAGPSTPAAPQAADNPRARSKMTAKDRAQEDMVAELEFQAQMLGLGSLEFAADLLPPGATSLEQIQKVRAMQDHIKGHRPEVLAAMIQNGLTNAAAEYAKFGDRVPARNIAAFIRGVLAPQK
ncbi:ERF family protein (plasmid) [Streptomyces sp. NBC_00536]|uniref:ERF family protein n=1 Tax=Streptomyces sp. NBC_00536 TaxID=2975769 RepID=UPI002E805AF7|nr:ERF family protein [Streptomyces sp. NBC_00536]WUC84417.1 ERF family protein [Streptomyces sp. NBC_00536]